MEEVKERKSPREPENRTMRMTWCLDGWKVPVFFVCMICVYVLENTPRVRRFLRNELMVSSYYLVLLLYSEVTLSRVHVRPFFKYRQVPSSTFEVLLLSLLLSSLLLLFILVEKKRKKKSGIWWDFKLLTGR